MAYPNSVGNSDEGDSAICQGADAIQRQPTVRAPQRKCMDLQRIHWFLRNWKPVLIQDTLRSRPDFSGAGSTPGSTAMSTPQWMYRRQKLIPLAHPAHSFLMPVFALSLLLSHTWANFCTENSASLSWFYLLVKKIKEKDNPLLCTPEAPHKNRVNKISQTKSLHAIWLHR